MSFPHHLTQAVVEMALLEDLGLQGDITTHATVSETACSTAFIVVRSSGVVAGLPLAKAAFLTLDSRLDFEPLCVDGATAMAHMPIARIEGTTRAILSGERVALNFLQRLCGIATLTHEYVKAVRGTHARIVCTRKTTPGLRAFEKYAVRMGGGFNHRFGLFDAVLVKDNHIAAAGGIAKALGSIRSTVGHLVKVEVEVDTRDQLEQALDYPIDAVLLDNMSTEDLRAAVETVKSRRPHVLTEASGGVRLDTVRAIAETGVDVISVGALTHSAASLDIGLDF